MCKRLWGTILFSIGFGMFLVLIFGALAYVVAAALMICGLYMLFMC
ncbi:hypothetical protein [Anaeropeptidivorans aminofermentans]|nr:hypothetical protein [Anaeropeptidivorans aminofermentans]